MVVLRRPRTGRLSDPLGGETLPVSGSRQAGRVSFTFTPTDYLRQPPSRQPVLARTGVSDLDQLLGGIRAGDVWVVAGPPRSGRSMLSIQLAAALADAGSPVRYFLGHDPIHETVSRFRAHTLGEPIEECRGRQPSAEEAWLGWSLDFVPDQRTQLTDHQVLPSPGPCSLVIDDLDLWIGEPTDFLDLARTWVQGTDRAAVITVPEHILRDPDPAIRQRWVRGANVILTIGQDTDGYTRFVIESNRAGPTTTIDIDDRFTYATFRSRALPNRAEPPTANPFDKTGSDHGLT